MSIPRRIFQTWKTKRELPHKFQEWSNTFRQLNPGFHYELWDDGDNRRFIANEFPWFLEIYDSYRVGICRVDALRYFYLYIFGGIYSDLDTECLRPLDDVLHLGDVVLGRMGSNPRFSHSVPNAIMASTPKQEFWLLVIQLLCLVAREPWRPEALTGPVILKAAVDMYLARDFGFPTMLIGTAKRLLRADQLPVSEPSTLALLDSGAWFPLDWSNAEHLRMRDALLNHNGLNDPTKALFCKDAWMITYWSHSWE